MLIAEEIACSNRQIIIFTLEANFHKILPAGAAERRGARSRTAPGTLCASMRDKSTAVRVQTQGDIVYSIVYSMEENVELRTESRRMFLFSDTAHKQIGLDLPAQGLLVNICSLGDLLPEPPHRLSQGQRFNKDPLKSPHQPIALRNRGYAGGDRPLRRR